MERGDSRSLNFQHAKEYHELLHNLELAIWRTARRLRGHRKRRTCLFKNKVFALWAKPQLFKQTRSVNQGDWLSCLSGTNVLQIKHASFTECL